jgi:Zn-dependent metalloprotease
MKKILLLAFLLTATASLFAQSAKTHPPKKSNSVAPGKLNFHPPQIAVPPAQNPFGLSDLKYQTLPAFLPPGGSPAPNVHITRAKNGMPILFEGKTDASANISDLKTAALLYLESLHPAGITNPAAEFVAKRVETDNAGNSHIRLEQVYQGVPVFGGEVIAHARGGAFDLLNGRYYPTPQLASVVPSLDAGRAIDQVKQAIGLENIKTDWPPEQIQLLKIEPFKAELVIYHHGFQLDNERLAWHVEAHPNMLERLIYFVDANTGEVIHSYDFTCKIDGGRHTECGMGNAEYGMEHGENETPESEVRIPNAEFAPPPVTGTGMDLLGQNRSFGAWQQGSTYYLEDASKPMYDATASTMPGDPVGVIVTLDGLNKSPENQNFDYTVFTSGSTNFSSNATGNGANAVSTHWNSIKSYDYYLSTHGRNSIDGVGGNILAFFNISEGDGSSMENAYWNGAAMWYGNGGSTFKKLARGLDVGGHEMTHGVVEKTANLVYQDESGALNESFADIFGAMIDIGDWLIGEDVMQSGTSPTGALRSLQDPHNGDVTNGAWWQPRTVSEQYNGSQDNGGVHINSGIPNWAYYKFATNASVGTVKAEQVYYKALKDYLVKSSQFVDLRIAVLQAANDLYPQGNTVALAAAAAFDQVGILGDTPGGNYLGQLPLNPGSDYVLCVTNDFQNIEVRNGSGQTIPNGTIYTGGVKSRPSITDNGSQIIFCNTEGHVISIDLAYTPSFQATVNPPLSQFPEWRNAIISKNGLFIAALTEIGNDSIYVFDLINGMGEAFGLYNPTYSTGQITGEVQYADVLEFDYSGEYIMYDAYNELSSTSSGDISYWDIGFLKFWENGGLADPANVFISKLFNGLPEKTSVGNPTFSKNSPYIIAFDFYDETSDQNDIYGANTETGDVGSIYIDNGAFGWSNYNRLDNALIYEGANQAGVTNIYKRPLAADKINQAGAEALFISDRQLGVWFANGNRSLAVSAGEPLNASLSVAVAPNPVTDVARLNIGSKTSANVQISVVNLLGYTVHSRAVQLAEGQNQLELNMENLPSGAYIVRLLSGNSDVAVKVVKQ